MVHIGAKAKFMFPVLKTGKRSWCNVGYLNEDADQFAAVVRRQIPYGRVHQERNWKQNYQQYSANIQNGGIA